jgi:hypothetical protein
MNNIFIVFFQVFLHLTTHEIKRDPYENNINRGLF